MRGINNKTDGFSLIELMIAMFIGLFLLTGLASSYLSSKKASVQQSSLSELEDNGRLALEFLSKAIEHAGYSPAINTPEFQFITSSSPVVVDNCEGGLVNVLDETIIKNTGDDPLSDSIGIVYHGDANNLFTDCSGAPLPNECRLKPLLTATPIPDAAKIYSSFYVDTANKSLMCAGSLNDQPEVIAEGVESIQYLYGVDMVDDDEIKVDRYLSASWIGSNWNNVVSVQIAILVRSLKPVKEKKEAKTFTLLDTIVATNDRYKHAVFSTTINLRNTF